MSDDKKSLGENPEKNQQGNTPQVQETERLKRIEEENKNLQENLKKLQEDLRIAREDVSKYQSEADRAKQKLSDQERLDLREEELNNKAHDAYMANIRANYPDVYRSFKDSFESLKGSPESDYIQQARYLQEGIDKAKAGSQKPNDSGGENLQTNNGPAPEIPPSNQKKEERHIFTRAELAEHQGDLEWFEANKEEIDRQVAEGLIK